jgi:hypothetical protein
MGRAFLSIKITMAKYASAMLGDIEARIFKLARFNPDRDNKSKIRMFKWPKTVMKLYA